MSLLLLLLPQLLRWEQQPQRALMKPAMAGKAPGPRRLDEDDPQELDDIPLVMLRDVVGGCLQIRKRNAHQCLQDDVLLMMSPMMSKDLSTDDLGVRRVPQDVLHLSVMHFSMSRMTLPVMKMDVIVVVGEIKMGSSEFVRGEFSCPEMASEVVVDSRCPVIVDPDGPDGQVS